MSRVMGLVVVMRVVVACHALPLVSVLVLVVQGLSRMAEAPARLIGQRRRSSTGLASVECGCVRCVRRAMLELVLPLRAIRRGAAVFRRAACA
jgi:hypothetical protein